jgi:hypothetical protein
MPSSSTHAPPFGRNPSLRPIQLRAAGALCLAVVAFGLVFETHAQSFAITRITRDTSGNFDLSYGADTNSYYLLLEGATLSNITTPSRMQLGVAGVGQFRSLPGSVPSTFYRVGRIPLLQPLDVDRDGLDDVTELRFPEALNPLDPGDRLTTISQSSPRPGEGDVAVTRETVFDFSMPLSDSTVLTTNRLYAMSGNRRVLSRVELSTDKRKATLFYLEPLPGSTRVSVVFDGTGLIDFLGRPLDLDGDSLPGGSALIRFDTLSLAAVPNTAVIGQVFASEPVQGPGTTNFVNRPLAGVTITIDGREQELRTTTDAEGRFKLQPVPAGKFFVHVDGRTAQGSQWPNGNYYPVVGKAWEAAAGRQDNLAGGNGQIFLPLIIQGTLQPASLSTNTVVTFPASVVSNNPAMAGVSITVPANSLFSDNGTRGGRVGIAPVPSDRLPEPLPPGLDLPIVITLQTDGPSNFDRPVPVRFPNLPDPNTGVRLPPGAKSALWSFNHDLGRWEIIGPMTVTADGLFVETDSGVGIRQPGWHGSQPGSQGEGGPLGAPNGGGPPGSPNDNDGDGVPNGEDGDVDGDGTPNGQDGDVDGDGTPNGQDGDVDGDGAPNGADDDTDGDGVDNGADDDVDGDGASNGEDGDVDGDGVANGADGDVDGDGVSNEQDNDDDGDGLSDYDDADDDGDGNADEECPGATPFQALLRAGILGSPPPCPNPCTNPAVQITAPVIPAPGFLCPNERFTFQATGTPAGGTFAWTGGTAAGAANAAAYTASFGAAGTHAVSVTYTCPGGGGSQSANVNVVVGESSGAGWVGRFLGDDTTDALNEPFESNVERFIAAMQTAGCAIAIGTTYRPVERAYLMHYCGRIVAANNPITPAAAHASARPAGVQICWKHFNADGTPNDTAASAAALAMRNGYGIVFPAAYPTLHSDRIAIDMTITWTTTNLTIVTGTGTTNVITSQPQHGGQRINNVNQVGNTDLHAVGGTYNVIKLTPDPPHWSSTGN